MLKVKRKIRAICSAEGIHNIYKNHSKGNQELLSDRRILVAWGAPENNFGDLLGIAIIKALSGKEFFGESFAREMKGPKFIALGSILHRASDGDIIWGTGHRGSHALRATRLGVRAVRGPLTRDYLLSKNIDCPEVYGDPAILITYFFKPKVKKEYAVGVVQHYNDRTDLTAIKKSGFNAIRVTDHPLKIIEEICKCGVILSSSLHGIIVSEAYGIPACWLRPGPELWELPEPDFKYNDYYLSTLREPVSYAYAEVFDIDRAVRIALNNRKPACNANKLLMSFPFLRQDIKSTRDLCGYEISGIKITLGSHLSLQM